MCGFSASLQMSVQCLQSVQSVHCVQCGCSVCSFWRGGGWVGGGRMQGSRASGDRVPRKEQERGKSSQLLCNNMRCTAFQLRLQLNFTLVKWNILQCSATHISAIFLLYNTYQCNILQWGGRGESFMSESCTPPCPQHHRQSLHQSFGANF